MRDHKSFGEAEPWSQDGDLRLESEGREETRFESLDQAYRIQPCNYSLYSN